MANYGNLADLEVSNVIVPELERWALRGDRWAGDGPDIPHEEEIPRPTGSEAYEELSTTRRREYIMDVLVPEAVVQMCILCEDLGNLAEQEAYDEAIVILKEQAAEDEKTLWEVRATELSMARSRARAERGLPPEHYSQAEIDKFYGNDGGPSTLSGRRIKVVKYKE